ACASKTIRSILSSVMLNPSIPVSHAALSTIARSMRNRESRFEYTARMHRVLQHIDDHLDEQLELDTLAAVANFSQFHFHRLFTAWMGETLGDYTRRRRLEVAAQRLVAQPPLPVLHVAMSIGFGSTEAFARAFKARFGSAPTVWQAAQVRNRAHLKSKFEQGAAPKIGRAHV